MRDTIYYSQHIAYLPMNSFIDRVFIGSLENHFCDDIAFRKAALSLRAIVKTGNSMTETRNDNQESSDTLEVRSKNGIAWLGLTVVCAIAYTMSFSGASPRVFLIKAMTGGSTLLCLFYLLKATVTTSYDAADDPLSVLQKPTLLERFIMIAIASITGSIIVAFAIFEYLSS